MLSANDDSNRDWAELAIKAQKDGAQIPQKIPADFLSLYQDTEEQEQMEAEQQAQQEQMMQEQQYGEQDNVNSGGY